jgi:hypothetical protein
MSESPAAEVAKRRLTTAARRLGVKNPASVIGGLLDRSFELPLGDPRYGNNELTPGYFPLEHSFTEVQPSALRLDLSPLGPQASAHARAQEASREMRRLVHESYGDPALRWFDERSEPWRGSTIHGDARFGAWFGLATDAAGLQEAKVYYEIKPGDVGALPSNLQYAVRIATEVLPGLVPIFTSIACGRKRGAQRVYFFHRGDLRLLELEPLLNRLGVGQHLPGLLAAVGVALGGRFILPEGSVILGLRDTQKGLELKLDVLVGAIPDPPPQMYQLINMVLGERPQAQADLRRWALAMTPDDEPGPGRISVVSFRVQPQLGARCSIYLRPSGYAQLGRRHAAPGEASPRAPRRPARTAPADPYRL